MKKASKRALDKLAVLGWRRSDEFVGVAAPAWVPFVLPLADGVTQEGAEDRRLAVVSGYSGWAVIGGARNRPANIAVIYPALWAFSEVIGKHYSAWAPPPGTGDAIRGAEQYVEIAFDGARVYLSVEGVPLFYDANRDLLAYTRGVVRLCAAPAAEAKPLPLLVAPTKRIFDALYRFGKVAGLGGRTVYVKSVVVEAEDGSKVRALRVEMNPLVGNAALWVSITSMPPAGGWEEDK